MKFNSAALIAALLFVPFLNPAAFAEENTDKKSSTQNIGGLLFDVDEGVKVEQGPGGSVYVKSNREFMQEKFQQIESKLLELENRVKQLEAKGAAAVSGAAAEDSGRRVLST